MRLKDSDSSATQTEGQRLSYKSEFWIILSPDKLLGIYFKSNNNFIFFVL